MIDDQNFLMYKIWVSGNFCRAFSKTLRVFAICRVFKKFGLIQQFSSCI